MLTLLFLKQPPLWFALETALFGSLVSNPRKIGPGQIWPIFNYFVVFYIKFCIYCLSFVGEHMPPFVFLFSCNPFPRIELKERKKEKVVIEEFEDWCAKSSKNLIRVICSFTLRSITFMLNKKGNPLVGRDVCFLFPFLLWFDKPFALQLVKF